MAMTRLLSQTLTHLTKSSPVPLSPLFSTYRHRSGKAQRAQFFEIDLDASSSSSSGPSSSSPPPEGLPWSSPSDVGGIRKLEEVIQNIIVRRAAPDWLPFRPGSSYWVPPPPSNLRNNPYVGVLEVLGRLSNAARAAQGVDGPGPSKSLALRGSSSASSPDLLTEDETMPLSYSRGWPSSSYFIEGMAPTFPAMEEVEVEVNILDSTKVFSTDEDEEG